MKAASKPRTRAPARADPPPAAPPRGHPVLPLLLALAAISAATLFPSDQEGAGGWDGCIFCGDRGLADAVLNVLLFVPLGGALALRARSLPLALGLAALLSAGVELAQLWIPGRDPSPPDLLFNVLGAAAGFAAVRSGPGLLLPPDRRAARRSLAAALLVSAVVGLTGVLVTPSFPRSEYYGQWTAELGRLARYGGRVLDARIGAVGIPPTRLGRSDPARSALLSGSPVIATVVAGPPPASLAPVLSVADDREREIFLLGVDGEDLVFWHRTAATDLRLDYPSLRARGLLRGVAAGDTLRLRVRRAGNAYTLGVNDRTERVGFTPGTGVDLLTATISPFAGGQEWIRAAWLGALLLPVGLWARRRRESAAAAVALALALGVVPGWVGLHPPTAIELAGAGTGIAAGVCLSLMLRRQAGGRRSREG